MLAAVPMIELSIYKIVKTNDVQGPNTNAFQQRRWPSRNCIAIESSNNCIILIVASLGQGLRLLFSVFQFWRPLDLANLPKRAGLRPKLRATSIYGLDTPQTRLCSKLHSPPRRPRGCPDNHGARHRRERLPRTSSFVGVLLTAIMSAFCM